MINLNKANFEEIACQYIDRVFIFQKVTQQFKKEENYWKSLFGNYRTSFNGQYTNNQKDSFLACYVIRNTQKIDNLTKNMNWLEDQTRKKIWLY